MIFAAIVILNTGLPEERDKKDVIPSEYTGGIFLILF